MRSRGAGLGAKKSGLLAIKMTAEPLEREPGRAAGGGGEGGAETLQITSVSLPPPLFAPPRWRLSWRVASEHKAEAAES